MYMYVGFEYKIHTTDIRTPYWWCGSLGSRVYLAGCACPQYCKLQTYVLVLQHVAYLSRIYGFSSCRVLTNKALHVKNVKKTARHALITRCMRASEGMRHTNAEARKYIFLIFTNYISILL